MSHKCYTKSGSVEKYESTQWQGKINGNVPSTATVTVSTPNSNGEYNVTISESSYTWTESSDKSAGYYVHTKYGDTTAQIYFSRTSSGGSGGSGGGSSDSNEITFYISQITTSTIKIKTSMVPNFPMSVTIHISDEDDLSGHYMFLLSYGYNNVYTIENTFNYTVSDVYKKYRILAVHPIQVVNNGKTYYLKYSETVVPVTR